MFEYDVYTFKTLDMVVLFLLIVSLFSFEITSTVPEACVSSERLLSVLN